MGYLKFFQILLLALATLTLIVGCQKDPMGEEGENTEPPIAKTLDEELTLLLQNASDGSGKAYFQLPAPTSLSDIPQDPNNTLTAKKVELGKLLFHETGFGTIPKNFESLATYSCASCHHAAAGFQAGVRQGVGEGGLGFGIRGEARLADPDYGFDFLDIQPIRSPTIINSAWQKVMLWNGQFGATDVNTGTESRWALRSPKQVNFLGFEGLESQAIAALKVHRMDVNPDNVEALGYKDFFDQAFNEIPVGERYTDTIAGLAMAAYERTTLSNEAPFQQWLAGKGDAMTEAEKKGAILFFGEAGCVRCHTGPALNSTAFYALGMNDLDGEGVTYVPAQASFTSAEGRGGFTGKDEDYYKFKVPQLYNLKDSPFYGHGANFTSVKSVIEYKNAAQPQNTNVPASQIHDGFQPLNLSNEEIDQLTIFIENSLYDPNLDRYAPDQLPSGNCFPNSDAQSRIDLNCE